MLFRRINSDVASAIDKPKPFWATGRRGFDRAAGDLTPADLFSAGEQWKRAARKTVEQWMLELAGHFFRRQSDCDSHNLYP
jgi:hypothetical protein